MQTTKLCLVLPCAMQLFNIRRKIKERGFSTSTADAMQWCHSVFTGIYRMCVNRGYALMTHSCRYTPLQMNWVAKHPAACLDLIGKLQLMVKIKCSWTRQCSLWLTKEPVFQDTSFLTFICTWFWCWGNA